MYEAIEQAERLVAAAVPGLEPGCLPGPEAARLLEVVTRTERLLAAVRLGLARRIEQSNVWRSEGHRSAGSFLATATGTTLGTALGSLETAQSLEAAPATAQAFRTGALSEAQATEIAAAAEVNPDAERRLLADAPRQGLAGLRRACRAARTAGRGEADYQRIRASRFLRHRTDSDGAVAGRFRLTPDDGALLLGAIEAASAPIFAAARQEGLREPSEAYAADALVALARSGGPGGGGPGAVINLRVDHDAWCRGTTAEGERCEIEGVGPIPVSVAHRLGSDAVYNLLVTDGVEVQRIVHLGRSIPAALRRALEERDPTCCVPGCEVRRGLEIDHRVPFAQGGPTALHNLARLCRFHHFQKTHRGFRLEGGPGSWDWRAPPEAPP